ncbi:MAG: PAS domain S-box protein [Deltaproteobacteria bacterium]|nr:PAS domain S-box protein [Deltaproteobacteria bacterium]
MRSGTSVGTWARRRSLRRFLLLLLVVFASETVVMLALEAVDIHLPLFQGAVLDALLLCLVTAPVIWRLFVDPLVEKTAHAQQLAATAQHNYQALIEHSPDAVVVHRQGRFVYVNPACLRYLGYQRAEDLLGRSVAEVVHPDDRSLVAERMLAAGHATEPLPPLQERFVRADGSIVFAEIVAMGTVFDGLPAVLAIARDLTWRRELDGRLATSDRLASMGMLTAGIAHEINNPLSFVLANVGFGADEAAALAEDLRTRELARSHVMDRLAEIRAALDDAREGAGRVRQLARDLKGLSRVRTDEVTLVNLRPVLEGCCNIAWAEIRHRARLVKEYGATPLVEANEGRLGQVFLNLLVNAAHAVPEGAPDRHVIRVETGRDEKGRARVTISDSGCGMSQQVIQQLFTPFFTTKPPSSGTGLGLSICHRIITDLGGEIHVESTPGQGSRFSVKLPAAAEQPAGAGAPHPATPDRARGRVLLVDDDPHTATLIMRALGGEHEVVVTAGAAEAVARLERDPSFDVILCDLTSATCPGTAVHAALRDHTELATRLVFLSGDAVPPCARTLLDTVALPRLQKPFDVRDLRALVRERLAQRAAARVSA